VTLQRKIHTVVGAATMASAVAGSAAFLDAQTFVLILFFLALAAGSVGIVATAYVLSREPEDEETP
jgi:hypothetical protein